MLSLPAETSTASRRQAIQKKNIRVNNCWTCHRFYYSSRSGIFTEILTRQSKKHSALVAFTCGLCVCSRQPRLFAFLSDCRGGWYNSRVWLAMSELKIGGVWCYRRWHQRVFQVFELLNWFSMLDCRQAAFTIRFRFNIHRFHYTKKESKWDQSFPRSRDA